MSKATDRATTQLLSVRQGENEIILPKGMGYPAAIAALQKKMAEEEEVIAITEQVDAYPLDGAIAFARAMKQMYGWATPAAMMTFFGPRPPQFVDVETDYGVHEKVVWGQFDVPNIAGKVMTSAGQDNNGTPVFVIAAQVKRKDEHKVTALATLTRELVRTGSIYKGKALRLKTNEHGEVKLDNPPSFLDLSRVREDELVFPKVTQEQVETNLFTPIERTEECRRHGIPLKRGVLLEGPYGVGKTLTAYVTAKKARDNKWTFIYLDRVDGLREALRFAQRYAPAIVFSEDIDRVVSGGRSMAVDDVLNIIDGVDSKHGEVITILTTNHVEKVERAMLRPGRLDAVIHIDAPDAAAVERLIHLYGRGLVPEGADLTEAANELAGQIPAVIREVVERSKLYAISTMPKNADLTLSGPTIAASARGMKHHLELLNPRADRPLTPQEALGKAMTEVVQDTLHNLPTIASVPTPKVVEHFAQAFGWDITGPNEN